MTKPRTVCIPSRPLSTQPSPDGADMNIGKKRIVVALGGNALGRTPEEQISRVRSVAEKITDLVQEGHEVIIGHGNGPQVGMINSAIEFAEQNGLDTPHIPLAECDAMTQGYIGYHLQQALNRSFVKRGITKTVVSVVTQVLVDPDDPAFQNPTKPIGNFYTEEQAKALQKESGAVYMEDAGRGWRRVVPSPEPRSIVELHAIRKMVQSGIVVIAAGGGGIPVILSERGYYKGVDAVVDKDKSAARLAVELKADMLIILTAVEQIYIYFNTPEQEALSTVSIEDARRYIREGQFKKGSMLPKVEAALSFVTALPDREALVTRAETLEDALLGRTGTRIFSEPWEKSYEPAEFESLPEGFQADGEE